MQTQAPAPLSLDGVSPQVMSLLTLCLYHRALHDALVPNKALQDVDTAIAELRQQLSMTAVSAKASRSPMGDNLVPALTREQILSDLTAHIPAEGSLWLIVAMAGDSSTQDWVRAVQQGEYPVSLCAASGYEVFQHYHQPDHICFRVR